MEVHNLLHYARELLQASTSYHVENLDITKNKYSTDDLVYLQNRTRFNHKAQAELNRLVTSILDQTAVEYERVIERVGDKPSREPSNLMVEKPTEETQLMSSFVSSLERQ